MYFKILLLQCLLFTTTTSKLSLKVCMLEDEIIQFLKKWSEFSKFLRQFMDKISIVTEQSHSNDFFIEYLDKQEIQRFYDDRIMLREMLFKLGEDNLIVGTIYEWEELKVKYPLIAKVGYKSPFSLILSIPNLAELIQITIEERTERPIRQSIMVSLNFIEYLSYQHPKVKEHFVHFWHLNIN